MISGNNDASVKHAYNIINLFIFFVGLRLELRSSRLLDRLTNLTVNDLSHPMSNSFY